MSLLEQAYRQRVEFLRRNLQPAVIMVPFKDRHQFLGEVFDRFGLSGGHQPGNRIGVMGMRVVFTDDVDRLEVLAGL